MAAKKVSPRIQKAADDYIGHPAEIEEDVDVWAKREAIKGVCPEYFNGKEPK